MLLTLILRGLLPGIQVVDAADDPERASRGGWCFDRPEPAFGKTDLRHARSRQRLGAFVFAPCPFLSSPRF